ncbi:Fic family protein [Pedobacter sp. CFBP9032]|uniref:Fic family protein n=1 Tax=Pedobacter sp. CFBP9032 TaxID=3096539 RepID=UPI002A69F7FA|nr:Fic family protein [Pedobacter sp. CFBP9032]MDY0907585.1 Fic family protein [Pedobacter sp. CFBP9032]
MLSKNLLTEIKRRSELLNSLKPLSIENQAKLDKKFRLEFNFNSNHLEGNTLTYGETELLLIFDQTEGTHDFREYQEMQAHDVALKMVQEEASDQERPLTEQFIRGLNAKLLVKPFWKDAITADGQPTRKQIIPGEYKKTPNSVRLANGEIFAYSAPEDVQNEIAELVTWFNEKSGTEDPVLLAALLHYRFVRIHPFDDGNGRTARLLMNYVFAKNNLPLVIIKSAEKKDYLAALNRADTGNTNAFVEYIGNQLLWSLDLGIKAAKGENIDEDDDLDKELELLKQELRQIPDEFDKIKSYPEIINILNKSIIPLYLKLNYAYDKLANLFVSADYSLVINSKNKDGNTKESVYRKDELLWMLFEDDKIDTISLRFSFVALKKSKKQKDIYHKFDIVLDKYHYSLIGNTFQTRLLTLPYGRFISSAEMDFIIKSVMNNMIEEIKQATNLKN